MPKSDLKIRFLESPDELDLLRPLWDALQKHHAQIAPDIGDGAPSRGLDDAWRVRRAKYERWLRATEGFYVTADLDGEAVGYAFVTIGAGYASWSTGDLLAELETISVLPTVRGTGIGGALLDAVWVRLGDMGVEDLQVTTALNNLDSHRFYERQGFDQRFVIYYANRRKATSRPNLC